MLTFKVLNEAPKERSPLRRKNRRSTSPKKKNDSQITDVASFIPSRENYKPIRRGSVTVKMSGMTPRNLKLGAYRNITSECFRDIIRGIDLSKKGETK